MEDRRDGVSRSGGVGMLERVADLAACPGGLSAKVLLVIMAVAQGLNTIRFKALPERSF